MKRLIKITSIILIQAFLLMPVCCLGMDNYDTLAPALNIGQKDFQDAYPLGTVFPGKGKDGDETTSLYILSSGKVEKLEDFIKTVSRQYKDVIESLTIEMGEAPTIEFIINKMLSQEFVKNMQEQQGVFLPGQVRFFTGRGGSGKTTAVRKMVEKKDAAVVEYDYFILPGERRPIDPQTNKTTEKLPEKFEHESYIKAVTGYLSGQTIFTPIFDRITRSRLEIEQDSQGNIFIYNGKIKMQLVLTAKNIYALKIIGEEKAKGELVIEAGSKVFYVREAIIENKQGTAVKMPVIETEDTGFITDTENKRIGVDIFSVQAHGDSNIVLRPENEPNAEKIVLSEDAQGKPILISRGKEFSSLQIRTLSVSVKEYDGAFNILNINKNKYKIPKTSWRKTVLSLGVKWMSLTEGKGLIKNKVLKQDNLRLLEEHQIIRSDAANPGYVRFEPSIIEESDFAGRLKQLAVLEDKDVNRILDVWRHSFRNDLLRRIVPDSNDIIFEGIGVTASPELNKKVAAFSIDADGDIRLVRMYFRAMEESGREISLDEFIEKRLILIRSEEIPYIIPWIRNVHRASSHSLADLLFVLYKKNTLNIFEEELSQLGLKPENIRKSLRDISEKEIKKMIEKGFAGDSSNLNAQDQPASKDMFWEFYTKGKGQYGLVVAAAKTEEYFEKNFIPLFEQIQKRLGGLMVRSFIIDVSDLEKRESLEADSSTIIFKKVFVKNSIALSMQHEFRDLLNELQKARLARNNVREAQITGSIKAILKDFLELQVKMAKRGVIDKNPGLKKYAFRLLPDEESGKEVMILYDPVDMGTAVSDYGGRQRYTLENITDLQFPPEIQAYYKELLETVLPDKNAMEKNIFNLEEKKYLPVPEPFDLGIIIKQLEQLKRKIKESKLSILKSFYLQNWRQRSLGNIESLIAWTKLYSLFLEEEDKTAAVMKKFFEEIGNPVALRRLSLAIEGGKIGEYLEKFLKSVSLSEPEKRDVKNNIMFFLAGSLEKEKETVLIERIASGNKTEFFAQAMVENAI